MNNTIYIIQRDICGFDSVCMSENLGWTPDEEEAKQIVEELNRDLPVNPFTEEESSLFTAALYEFDRYTEELAAAKDPNLFNEFWLPDKIPHIQDQKAWSERQEEIVNYLNEKEYEFFQSERTPFKATKEQIIMWHRWTDYNMPTSDYAAYYTPYHRLTLENCSNVKLR